MADLIFPRFNGDALCADYGPDRWFPESSNSGHYEKRICNRCPVQEDCLTWALANEEPYGIWGGLSAEERRDLRRAS